MKLNLLNNSQLPNVLPPGITPEINAYINMVADTAAKKAVEELAKVKQQSESTINEEFLSAVQASDFLKIKLNTLYSKVEKGELPSYRSGKRKLLFSKKNWSFLWRVQKQKVKMRLREKF